MTLKINNKQGVDWVPEEHLPKSTMLNTKLVDLG